MTRLDHLVILTSHLDRAVSNYEELGFTVTPGGEHADGLTRNALIPFKDGSYFELVAFVDPEDNRDNIWGWRRFLRSGGGLIDYCAASDDLRADVRRLREADFEVEGPIEGGRRRPDGKGIRWLIALMRQQQQPQGRLLPFLIEDLTSRQLRVPSDRATEHPNGALGIRRLEISSPDLEGAVRAFTTLLEVPPSGTGSSLRLGECALSLVRPEESRVRLETVGPGPLAVRLATDMAGSAGELDRRLSEGVSMQLLEPPTGG